MCTRISFNLLEAGTRQLRRERKAWPLDDAYAVRMRQALLEARRALETGDVPVAAILIDASGAVIGVGRNERELRRDPTAHAEILALRAAAQATGSWQLPGTTLVVTLEPCVMCAGAILAARVEKVVFGAWDEKAGAAGSVYDVLRDRRLAHRVEVRGGVEEEACSALLTDFFRPKRSGLSPRP
jgi:tRNA(adenine34) deaminase